MDPNIHVRINHSSTVFHEHEPYKPICFMYSIFTYIWAICWVNVGQYSIHGAYGKLWLFDLQNRHAPMPPMPCLCTSPRHAADQRRAHRAGRQQVARRHGLLVRRVRRIGHGEANWDGVGIYMGCNHCFEMGKFMLMDLFDF